MTTAQARLSATSSYAAGSRQRLAAAMLSALMTLALLATMGGLADGYHGEVQGAAQWAQSAPSAQAARQS
ncbi:MAG: hypothetical protein KBC73_03220 [Burkholderiaceae bacterium]|nr:hypothetical protein [Burkholderiaceae bacterium]